MDQITPSIVRPLSPSGERMRRYRVRQRKGLRCITIEIREAEIDALVRGGLLKRDDRDNCNAVARGLYKLFELTLRTAP